MPTGITIDVLAVVLGSILGPTLGALIPKHVMDELSTAFGFVAALLAVTSLTKVCNVGAVGLTTIVSFLIGSLIDIDSRMRKGIDKMCRKLFSSADKNAGQLSVYVVLFAFSATGIMGAIDEAGGNSQIIICKAVLDFMTALIVSYETGRITALSAVIQAAVLFLCYFLAGKLSSILTGETYGDLAATGGILLLMIAFNMMKVVKTKPINGVLGFIIIVPISRLWQSIF